MFNCTTDDLTTNLTSYNYVTLLFNVSGYILKTAFLLHAVSGKLHCQILFDHDNAPEHMAKTVRTILQEFHWETLSHPPSSSDLASCDFLASEPWPCVLEHCRD